MIRIKFHSTAIISRSQLPRAHPHAHAGTPAPPPASDRARLRGCREARRREHRKSRMKIVISSLKSKTISLVMKIVRAEVDPPGSVLALIKVDKDQLGPFIKRSLAVELYREGRLSLGKAAELAGAKSK